MGFNRGVDPAGGNFGGSTEITSCHPHAANILMADGSVHSINNTIDPKILEAMTTIDGGEAVKPPDF